MIISLLSFFLLSVFLWRCWGRIGEIFRGLDAKTAEMMMYFADGVMAWRFGIVSGHIPAPFSSAVYNYGHAQNVAGSHLASALSDLWVSLLGVNLPWFAVALLLGMIFGIFGMLRDYKWLRTIVTALGAAWWFSAGYLFTVHSPLHDNGVWFFGFSLVEAFAFCNLWVELDRKHCFAFLDTLQEKRQRKKVSAATHPNVADRIAFFL